MKRVVFAGGGTGGHLFPGLALAGTLVEQDGADIAFIGTAHGLDRTLVGKSGFAFHPIAAGRGSPLSLRKPLNLPRFMVAMAQSLALLRTIRPDVMIALGGYAAAAPGLMARVCGIPLVLLEQNTIPGRVNRLLSRWACQIHLQFAEAKGYFQQSPATVMHSGSPIRASVRSLAGETRDSADSLLIMGGSQGARRLNELVTDALSDMTEQDRPPIVHLAGEAEAETVRTAYASGDVKAEVIGFADDMASCYRRARLCISRAGAMSCAELAVAGIPTVFVPLPSAKDDHQRVNAESMASSGGAVVMEQQTLTPETLRETIQRLWADEERLDRMSVGMRDCAIADASERIAGAMRDMLGVTAVDDPVRGAA